MKRALEILPPLRARAATGDAHAQAAADRASEVVTAYDAWRSLIVAVDVASGFNAAGDRLNDLHVQLQELFERAFTLRAPAAEAGSSSRRASLIGTAR